MKFRRYYIVVLLFIISLFNKLYAGEYVFKCKFPDVNEQAKGTYKLDSDTKLIYTNTSGREIDITATSSIKSDNPNMDIYHEYINSDALNWYNKSFYDFDENGNIYFLDNYDYAEQNPDNPLEVLHFRQTIFIYKFNPVTLQLDYKKIKSNAEPGGICVTRNGKWIFVDLKEDYDGAGKPGIYAINSDFKSEPVLLYKIDNRETNQNANIVNICLDYRTQIFYFSIRGLSDNTKVDGLGGLYELKPDENGDYLSRNLNRNDAYEDIPVKLYTNKKGLWGVTGNNTLHSKLIYIKDEFGQPVTEQPKKISKVDINDYYFQRPDIFTKNDYFLYLNRNKTDVFKYEDDNIIKVTRLAADRQKLSYDSLMEIAETIENRRSNKMGITGNNDKLFIVLVSGIVFLFVIIVALSLWILKLTEKTNQFKKNKRFIFNIQEAERGKISRDIHDSIIQDIRAIRIETELLNVASDSENRKNKVINIATDCVVKLRNICYNLTPAELATHEEGDSSKIELVSIIQNLVLQFIERTHVPCQLKIDENFEYPVLDKETSQNLYRIIQEALNNIEKHSYATNCQILIKNKIIEDKKSMLVYISDDGVGCDISDSGKRHGRFHFGLQNMKDRAALIGATISFHSEPGQGFEVRVEI